MNRFRTTKTCPRCAEKCDITDTKCPDCGLVFSRLEFASNKLAKKNLLQGKKHEVIRQKGFPKDVRKSRVLIMAIFLGLFGAHNIYVGKFWKGFFMAFCGLMTLVCVVFNGVDFVQQIIVPITIIPIGIGAFMWLFDIFDICINRFKVPISIDMEMNI